MTFEESQKQLRYWDLKQRLTIAQQKAMPGISGGEILPELEALIRESEQILSEGLPPFIEAKDLLSEVAHTEWCIGLLYSWLGDLAQSALHYERAALRYEESGHPEMAKHCRENIESNQLRQTGDLDETIRKLQERLDQTQPGTLDRIAVLLEISDAYLSAGDELAAEDMLNGAEAGLQSLGLHPPTAEELIEGLKQSLDLSGGAEEMQARFRRWDVLRRAHDGYKKIYLSRSYLERKRNPAAARSFMDRFRQLNRNEPSPEALNDLLEAQKKDQRRQWEEFQASLPEILRPEVMEASFDELRQVLGEEAVRQGFGEDPVRELREINRLNEEIRNRWNERQDQQEFRLRFDLEELWQEHACLIIEEAGTPAGSSRDDLARRTDKLERSARHSANPEALARTLLLKGDLLAAERRDEEALAALREAESFLDQVSRHDLRVFILRTEAEIYARQQDWQHVSKICEEGIRSVEQYRFQVTAPYLQSAYLKSRIGLYRLGVRSACELRDWEKALERADLSKCRAILGYSQLPHLQAQDLTTLEERFRNLTGKIHTAASEGAPLEDLERERRDLWARIFMERARGQTRANISCLDLHRIQESLEPDEAVLYYYWIDRASLLLSILDRENLQAEIREIPEARRAALERFVYTLAPRGPARSLRRLSQEPSEILRDLAGPAKTEDASSILSEIAGVLLPDSKTLVGKRKLLISPHSLLHSLPFHALPWSGAPLLRQFEVLYVPNLGSLAFQFEPAKQARILLVGTCEFEASAPPLAMAEQEVSEIAAIYQHRGIDLNSLIGEEASTSRLHALEKEAQGFTQFSCLHFAVHGSSVPENFPMESKLLLRDAPLDGMEISNWRLAADLVVLSACWSASRPSSGRGMDELPGDEMFGLQAAFFSAGARRVLGALWPVQDETACAAMVRLHQHLVDGHSPEAALRLALLSLLDSSAEERDFLDWAPFYIVALGHPISP